MKTKEEFARWMVWISKERINPLVQQKTTNGIPMSKSIMEVIIEWMGGVRGSVLEPGDSPYLFMTSDG